ncbi:hypothetical protein [Rugamonas apoptosis]|uniref:Uncharacterized protein n=1 Tax=Rugamonas apoptosis TaxID=2758570 RepID=A0A7W2IJP6_9BURK|nr:hypothetical protein [Rugamonas apoptosis]MBA5686748.1 hypothetical protein [Rugamonas apoptosis]
MTTQTEQAALAADKMRLIREGELQRVKVAHAKAQLGMALRPEALLHSAVDQASALAQARLGGLLSPGGLNMANLKTVLPIALTVGSFIMRKRLLKPALGVGAVVALGVAWLARRKRTASTGE